jgi:hypothetical protein
MHPNQRSLELFYEAFARLDAAAMAPHYAADAQFDDEVFSLRGRREIAGMWTMLCEATRAKGLDAWKLQASAIAADPHQGRAHWEAHYRFSATGRLVHNVIEARFEFNAQGLILRHRDSFSFWSWSRQALGMPGLLLGWTPFLRSKVRAQAAANLQRFLAAPS